MSVIGGTKLLQRGLIEYSNGKVSGGRRKRVSREYLISNPDNGSVSRKRGHIDPFFSHPSTNHSLVLTPFLLDMIIPLDTWRT